MKKKIRNTISLMLLLLIAACFPTHNNVYKQSVKKKQLNICRRAYNHKKWSAPITYYSNHDASYKLLISHDIKLKFEDNKTVELSRVHIKRIIPISPRCATYEQKRGDS